MVKGRGELLRFLGAGLLGLLADVGVLYCALALGSGWFAGRALSFLCAVWVTWQFNRRFTFTPREAMPAWEEWWRYLSAMLLGGVVNYGAYTLVVLTLPYHPWLPLAAVSAGSLAGLSVNFLSAKYFVFHRS